MEELWRGFIFKLWSFSKKKKKKRNKINELTKQRGRGFKRDENLTVIITSIRSLLKYNVCSKL